jgi:CheY-like chemotaxis protein
LGRKPKANQEMGQASILLVEDEVFIRMMLVQMVEELGHKVVAEASSVDVGQSLAKTEEYDLAILDINLQGFNVWPVAEVVMDRGLPFFFLSGYSPEVVPDGFNGTLLLNKPCTLKMLKRTIDFVLSSAR